MDESKYLTAFRALAEKIEYQEITINNYYEENARLKNANAAMEREIVKLKTELEVRRG